MSREEELAKGLETLQRDMSRMMQHVTAIQSLVPVIDFGDMLERDEQSDETMLEARTATPPAIATNSPYQVPLFEPPITIVFENVIINGESVDLEEMEQIDGSSS